MSMVSSAFAGSGTSADPWVSKWVNWGRASQSGFVSAYWDDVTPVVAQPYSFWSNNPNFTIQKGFYIGVQTNISLKGNSAGLSAPTGAMFSLFGTVGGYSTNWRNLDGVHCSSTADGSAGVSCAIPYTVSQGVSYRVTVEAAFSVIQSECPTLTWSGTSAGWCVVYRGYISPTS